MHNYKPALHQEAAHDLNSAAHTILSLVTEIAHAYKNRQTDYIMENVTLQKPSNDELIVHKRESYNNNADVYG